MTETKKARREDGMCGWVCVVDGDEKEKKEGKEEDGGGSAEDPFGLH